MPFWKKKPEVSPGGSGILRHEESGRAAIGYLDPPVGAQETREAIYTRFFGEAESVSHELIPQVPHIDVYIHKPGFDDRTWYTLITGGMSDQPMKLPKAASDNGARRRVELVFYCSEPKDEYIKTLRWLAHFPHSYKTWVSAWHTIPNGDPPAPFWGSQLLDTVFLMPSIVGPDRTLADHLAIDGDPVELLWIVPLTKAECDLKLAKGAGAVLELFKRHKHPHVFDPDRSSYC